MTLTVLLLGAGQSTRMRGRDKLLEPVAGVACVRALAERALGAGLPVVVTVPALTHARARALQGLDITLIAVPDASAGMSRSIVTGVAALPQGTSAVMIVPADMPDLQTADFITMAAACARHPNRILRAENCNGQPGHPVVLPADVFGALSALTGDIGAQQILMTHADRVQYVALPDRRATTDLDTPEDWDAWRSKS
jgi:molybdenum cofactor cytidylyltransferase